MPKGAPGRKGRRGTKRRALARDENPHPQTGQPAGGGALQRLRGLRRPGYRHQAVDGPLPARALAASIRKTVVAALPKGIAGHFGPNLKRFVLSQHHQGQVTIPRLTAQLTGLGIAISKRQIVRLLSSKQDALTSRYSSRTL